MIQFDDPACLLFTSVSPQTGFISKILDDFKIKMRFGSENWSGVLQCDYFEPAGLLEEDYPITTFFESKTLKFFFSSEIITFINLRALSWEVRCVQTVLKFSTVGQLNLECYLVRLQKKKNLRIYCFKKKLCDWIIFFQVPRFKQSHCNVPIGEVRYNSRAEFIFSVLCLCLSFLSWIQGFREKDQLYQSADT